MKNRYIRIFWKTLTRLTVLMGAAVLLTAGATALWPETILPAFLRIWSVAEPAPDSADAMIVLGGGDGFRPEVTAGMWKDGVAPVIIVCNPADKDGNLRGGETVAILTDDFGVSPEAIELNSRAVTSTYEEAREIAAIAEKRKYKSVVIPTHLFHTRRVRWLFKKYLPDDCEVFVTEAPYVHFQIEDWWKNQWGREHFPREVAKTFYYWVRY